MIGPIRPSQSVLMLGPTRPTLIVCKSTRLSWFVTCFRLLVHLFTGLLIAKLEDAKAEEIVKIGLDGKSTVADVMIVASGRSNRHVGAIAGQLIDALKAGGAKNVRVEGMPHCDWVLLDAGEAIVHIFRPEVRSFYNLEKLWSDLAPDERLAS